VRQGRTADIKRRDTAVVLERAVLTLAVVNAAQYGLIDVNITIPDFDIVAAFRIGANPSFVLDRSARAPEI